MAVRVSKPVYLVVAKTSWDDLTKEVQSRLDDGWVLQGGVSVTMVDQCDLFCQAMTREEMLDDSK